MPLIPPRRITREEYLGRVIRNSTGKDVAPVPEIPPAIKKLLGATLQASLDKPKIFPPEYEGDS
jgi:hypothetical protein